MGVLLNRYGLILCWSMVFNDIKGFKVFLFFVFCFFVFLELVINDLRFGVFCTEGDSC